MNEKEDNVFSRWSRRKRAMRHGEPSPRDEGDNTTLAQGHADHPEQQQATADHDGHEAAEPLPRLEDLTAQSDLSAFLRKDVPKALQNAAMRKMWSLDPAIRNYVGPAEYAWDFNRSGSMAGFGPRNAKEAITNVLSVMSGGKNEDPTGEPSASPTETPPEQQIASPPLEEDAVAIPETKAKDAPLALPADAPATVKTIAAEPDRVAGPSHTVARARHGGALPR